LILVDIAVLYWINGHHSDWLDQVMWSISGKWTFLPLYLWMIVVMARRWGKRVGIVWVAMALLITASDQLASSVFKPMVKRERPTYTEGVSTNLHLVVEENGNPYKGGQFGFYSSHASNTLAVALLFMLMLRPIHKSWTLILGLWVVLVGYSRVYLGVHFPSDILMGWSMGTILALAFWKLLKWSRVAHWHQLDLY
jgi:undecaprenyl-diphosphatase